MRNLFQVIIFSMLVAGYPLSANGAVLYFSPASQHVFDGSTFVTELWIDTESESVNAIFATVHFPVNILEVTDVQTGGSAFPLYPQDPVVSNDTGSLVLQAGVPKGLNGTGMIGRIFFLAKDIGEAAIRISGNSEVLLNDGFGTVAAMEKREAFYTVFERIDHGLNMYSKQYPSEDFWYRDSSITLEWNTKSNATYSYELSSDPSDVPDEIPETGAGRAEYIFDSDGIFYFHIRECIDGACGTTLTRRIMKDAQPPEPFVVHIGRAKDVYDGKSFLSFFTTDGTSGVDYYKILITPYQSKVGEEHAEATWNTARSPHVLADDFSGGEIKIQAVDKAGNERIATLFVENRETGYKNYLVFAIIIGIGIIILYAVIWLRKLMLRKNKNTIQ